MLKNKPKTTFVSAETIKKTLQAKPSQGKKLLKPLSLISSKNNLPLNILESKKVLEGDAEVHEFEGDLWNCIQGTITFICGGELVNPKNSKDESGKNIPGEFKAKSIKKGRKMTLKKGDWLWIPPGQPHQHLTENLARLFVIKIPIKNNY